MVCRKGMSHQRCAGWLQRLSFLVVCREVVWHRRCAGCVVGGVGIGAVVDAVGCGIGGVGMAVFVEGFLLTFAGGMVILKVHIWEHSGPFGYLIPIWLVV